MRENDAAFLHHVLDAIAQIETYSAGLSYAEFSGDRLVQDGVIRQLEITGEACRNLSDELRDQHPDVPWKQIIGVSSQ